MMTTIVTSSVAVILLLWTFVDSPGQSVDYRVTGQSNDGDTIVTSTLYCSTESNLWYSIAVGWQALILLLASALAFMASRIPDDINDSRKLTLLVICHVVFVILRVATILVNDAADLPELTGYRSLILSSHATAALLVFVFPKLLQKSEAHDKDEPLPDLFLKSKSYCV